MPQPLSATSTTTSPSLADGGDRDPTVGAMSRLDRLERVDQQVQEDLVELGRRAGDLGDLAEMLLDGDAAAIDPAADHLEGRPDRLVDVGLVDLGAVEAGEAAEVLHDVGHPLDSLARAVEELVHVLLDVIQVELVGEPGDLLDQLGSRGLELGLASAVDGQHVEQEADVALEDGQVVGDVRQGVVDLVGDARGEHAERGQLLRLHDAAAHLVPLDELADLAAEAGHHVEGGAGPPAGPRG